MLPELRLSQFTDLVQQGITTLFGEHEFLIIWEVSKVKKRNTRFYIELVEYQGSTVIAHAHGLISNQSILRNPLQERWITLDEIVGKQILMTCRVNFHKDYGVQLHIQNISSEYTLGTLKKKEQDIKGELKSLGIAELNKQKKLGLPPYRIAVISSPSSEGLKDFLQVMQESEYLFSYQLFESAIHGNNANGEIYQALQKIYKQIDEEKNFELVLIVRGGGGASGVMRYNDINIAKGICYMQVPVMMAVGHTNDQTLLDEIACFSAKTPTDAAYQIISYYEYFHQVLKELYEQLNHDLEEKKQDITQEIDKLYEEIWNMIQSKLETYRSNIQSWYELISNSRPEKMLQSGYALLHSLDWKLMTKRAIGTLKKGDELKVKVYDKILKVKLEDMN
jgi:exodeoxyribonuclease VII large subunit